VITTKLGEIKVTRDKSPALQLNDIDGDITVGLRLSKEYITLLDIIKKQRKATRYYQERKKGSSILQDYRKHMSMLC